MQNIVIEKPYQFIPPHRGKLWPSLIQRFQLVNPWLRRKHGVVAWECRHLPRLRTSLAAGHGILLTPNHCRPCDAIVMGLLAREAPCLMFAMASWHLFQQDRWTAFAIRRMGAFSIYREGIDRQAIDAAIRILEAAERPLIIFPEGAITRTNDQLQALLDGVAFISRAAAKRRIRRVPHGKVVIHPVALRYLFQGDVRRALDPVLTDIEHRLTWRPQRHLPLVERITKLGLTLLSLKEMEYLGQARTGAFKDRLAMLIDDLLGPWEEAWLGGRQTGAIVPRVKSLRMKIVPGMVRGEISAAERQRRWQQLADIYLAQQVASYPPDYLTTRLSEDRLLETVERFEEDLTDQVRVLGPTKVVIEVGEAIEASPTRSRKSATDPLMDRLRVELQGMLDRLALESPAFC